MTFAYTYQTRLLHDSEETVTLPIWSDGEEDDMTFLARAWAAFAAVCGGYAYSARIVEW